MNNLLSKLQSNYYSVYYGIQNLYRFFKIIWRYRTSDFAFMLDLLQTQLTFIKQDLIKYSDEEDEYILDNKVLGKNQTLKELTKIIDLLDSETHEENIKEIFEKLNNTITKLWW